VAFPVTVDCETRRRAVVFCACSPTPLLTMIEFVTAKFKLPAERMPTVLVAETRVFWIVTVAGAVLLAPAAEMPVPLLTS
jgi:hypothetical protein